MRTHITSLMKMAGVVVALAFANVASAADAVSKADKEFFKNAGELCVTGIELAKMGQAKASDPALKGFSTNMIKDHMAADKELTTLAKQKGVEVAKEPTSSEKRMISGLAEKSGAEFDREYREHLVKDHEKGVRMLQNAERESKDADIRTFAARHLPMMQEHLAVLKGGGEVRTTERRERAPGGAPAPSREPAVRTQ